MKKFLYITDQDEYTDHSFIGPLFEKYLQEHFDVNIIYFSQFKAEFEKKDETRFVLPIACKAKVIKELKNSGIDLSSYSYVFVRNSGEILKDVLANSKVYDYKVGYRLSFPKRRAKMQVDSANNKGSFLKYLNNTLTTFSETKLINQCDLFLPSSKQMQEEYFSDVKTRTYICPPAIDPEILHENIQHESSEKRFFYAGTLDKLREFETVLEAFDSLHSSDWSLTISTKDPEYAKEVIDSFENLKDRVKIQNAKTKDELLDLIAKADIGVSILPDIPLFNTSTPVKIMDYYSSAVPCIMTDNANNSEIFQKDRDAWFCEFNKNAIKEKLEYILDLPKEEVAQVGINGQNRLLDVRNYKRIAADLAHQLNIL
ncbi:glycosyl transferase family 1 [Halarcobacter ebronensis]|uniref:Glycosyl transferase family 1 n=1 Tax=Halarcobacter ebronensis TaxID=1462615 RepID=A0A4Q1AFU7_9BACT|nr:glycosyltransferase [Halarcobacter ebronensis]QKF83063.1 glycosyltransferase, family 1 [Halarcobacter ebronensis]RXJ65404.1 glycosyl transferase family 1 [Halarcobacter ebronensis]RXK02420.1 glycosyl transferase family 1 [Halarcobacter ebronensis]